MDGCVSASRCASSRRMLLLVAAIAGPSLAQAQALVSPPPNILLSTTFRTPLRYEEVLTRLGSYYQQQVGRILPLTFPEIVPQRHFETWHDLFVHFEPAEKGMSITVKRPTEGLSSRIVKSWMLDISGRVDASLPLEFKEEPPLQTVEADLFASGRDMMRAFQMDKAMKSIPTWEHAGLMVSAAPLSWIMMSPAGLHGVHHVKVEAESLAAARQILARLTQEVQKPGIYGAYSEESELRLAIHEMAAGGQTAPDPASGQAVYVPSPDETYFENKLRSDPDLARRSAAAQGQFTIRCRLDRSYPKVTASWSELTGYSRASGRYEAERRVGQSSIAGPKPPPVAAPPLTLRTKLPALRAGAYRIRLESEDNDGAHTRIDERTYWFDGKAFEEL